MMTEATPCQGSIAEVIGHALNRCLSPWDLTGKIGTALIGAFAAKEVFVATAGHCLQRVGKEANWKSLRASRLPSWCQLIRLWHSASCSLPGERSLHGNDRGNAQGEQFPKWALFQLAGLDGDGLDTDGDRVPGGKAARYRYLTEQCCMNGPGFSGESDGGIGDRGSCGRSRCRPVRLPSVKQAGGKRCGCSPCSCRDDSMRRDECSS